jgi:hypothetical protein
VGDDGRRSSFLFREAAGLPVTGDRIYVPAIDPDTGLRALRAHRMPEEPVAD